MDRHYWVEHKKYAKDNNVPNKEDKCPICRIKFTRSDNKGKHMKKFHPTSE